MWPLNYFQSTQKELKRDLSKQRDTAHLAGGTSERVAACEEYARAPLTDSWVEFNKKPSSDCEKPLIFKSSTVF